MLSLLVAEHKQTDQDVKKDQILTQRKTENSQDQISESPNQNTIHQQITEHYTTALKIELSKVCGIPVVDDVIAAESESLNEHQSEPEDTCVPDQAGVNGESSSGKSDVCIIHQLLCL